MEKGVFNESKYQVNRDIMFLLNATKMLINRVVLPKIVHIFGSVARQPHNQQRQQETGLPRVQTLALVNKIVEPKLKHLDEWQRDYHNKKFRSDLRQEINLQYPNAEDLDSVNFNYKLCYKVKNTFRHCSAHL
jgi:ribosomal protein S15P/S13E